MEEQSEEEYLALMSNQSGTSVKLIKILEEWIYAFENLGIENQLL